MMDIANKLYELKSIGRAEPPRNPGEITSHRPPYAKTFGEDEDYCK